MTMPLNQTLLARASAKLGPQVSIAIGLVVLAILLYALLGKLADVAARGLERVWLRWHPAYQAKAGAQ